MADMMEKAMNFVSEKVGNMEKPEADITDFDLKKVSMDSISYHAKVSVKNPYSVPVPIMQISYTLKCSGRSLPISSSISFFRATYITSSSILYIIYTPFLIIYVPSSV